MLVFLIYPASLAAQTWEPGLNLPLVRRAVEVRHQSQIDTPQTWRANAHGFVWKSWLVGPEQDPIEDLFRADELRLEVFGFKPGKTGQIIKEWRDTSMGQPSPRPFYSNHLGIITGDFDDALAITQMSDAKNRHEDSAYTPPVIHPLSSQGLSYYRFRLGGTVTLKTSERTINVTVVDVHPADPTTSGIVGTLYLDAETAAIVRMQFTFTRITYLDPPIGADSITVMLENALIQNMVWLPWRQSITLRRSRPLIFPWMGPLPVDGRWGYIFHAKWELQDYVLGEHFPDSLFNAHDDFVQPTPTPPFSKRAAIAIMIRALDTLPPIPWVPPPSKGWALDETVNRVQGGVLEVSAFGPLGANWSGRLGVGAASRDERGIGVLAIERRTHWGSLSLKLESRMRDVGDIPVISNAGNMLMTAQGKDRGDWTLVDQALVASYVRLGVNRLNVEFGREHSTSVVAVWAPPKHDTIPNPPLGAGVAMVARASLSRRTRSGNSWSVKMEGGAGDSDWLRISTGLEFKKAVAPGEVRIAFKGGAATSGLPGYRNFVLGGRATLNGIPFRAQGGTRMALLDLSLSREIRIGEKSLPKLVSNLLTTTIAPFFAAGIAGGDQPRLPWRGTGQVEPVAGIRVDFLSGAFRFEFGTSLRHGTSGVTIDFRLN